MTVTRQAAARVDGQHSESVSTCYLCGAPGHTLFEALPDQLYGAPGRWRLRHCDRCELIWLDPRPPIDDLARLYVSHYNYTHAASYGAPGPLGRRWHALEAAILASAFGYPNAGATRAGRLLGHLLARLPPARDAAGAAMLWQPAHRRGRLLDVGCGAGQFMARMRAQGWTVCGVEPDGEAAAVAREAYGLDVVEGSLDTAALPEGAFDLITLSHVIEHVPDPVALLAACRRLLAPDGQIAILTPNALSLGRRVLRRRWFLGWSPPWHLFVFTPGTLRAVVERAGLDIAMMRTSARGARLAWTVNQLLEQCGTLPQVTPARVSWPLRLAAVAFWAAETAALPLLAAGEELVLFAGPRAGTQTAEPQPVLPVGAAGRGT